MRYNTKTLNKALLSLAIRHRSEDLKHLIPGIRATQVTGLAYIKLGQKKKESGTVNETLFYQVKLFRIQI